MKPYYEHAGITIYHGDCREVLPTLEFDAVLTDPPYGIGMKYGGEQKDSVEEFREHVETILKCAKQTAFTLPVSRLWEIPKPQWVAVWHKPMTFGFWCTPLFPHWEPIALYNWPNKGVGSDVIIANTAKPNGHPTPKPIELFSQLLAYMDGTICDPFCGSGTTLRAAKNANRCAIGIEIEEKYCEIAAKRLAQEVLPL